MTLKLDGTGSITGIDQGLNVVGVVTYSTDLNVGGDLNVTGVLTYDDVTNIDSIGVVTARSGVHVGTEASGTLINGNSNGIGIGTNNPQKKLTVADFEGSTDTELIRITQGVDSGTQQEFGIGFAANINHTHPAAQITYEEHDASDSRGHLIFYTRGDNSDSAPSERLRITSTGNIGIGNTIPLYAMHFKNEMSATPSYIHMEVTGTNTVGGGGGIAFDTSASNAASNNSLYLATIRGERTSADNGSNNLVFSTSLAGVAGDDGNTHSPAERLRIGSAGQIGLSGANYGTNNQVITSTGTGSAAEWRGVNPAFYGYQGTAHNVAHQTWTIVKNLAGTGSPPAINTTGWNSATGLFTADANTAGTWYIFGCAGIDDIQSLDVVYMGIMINGTNPSVYTHSRMYSGAANSIMGGGMVAAVVTLADGDTVGVGVYHNEGSTEPTEPNRCFAGGFRLSV